LLGHWFWEAGHPIPDSARQARNNLGIARNLTEDDRICLTSGGSALLVSLPGITSPTYRY
jgi:glycerate-2-kinase